MVTLFAYALPVLEEQSFAKPDSLMGDFNGSCSNVIAMNHTTLMQDLERLNDILTIARNMLATTTRAQNLAAEAGFDQQVLKLVDICVRVTARGFDGEVGRSETQWASAVGSCKSSQTNSYCFGPMLMLSWADKKLLITCLQFLHNLVMHNEHRKLLLWLDLFGNSKSSDPYSTVNIDTGEASDNAIQQKEFSIRTRDGVPSHEDLNLALTTLGSTEDLKRFFKTPEAGHLASEVLKTVDGFVNMTLGQHKKPAPREPQDEGAEAAKEPGAASSSIDPSAIQSQKQSWNWANLPDSILYSDPRGSEIQEDDTRIGRSPQSAAETLKEAKDQLMARLQDPSPFPTGGAEREQHDLSENNGDRRVADEGDAPGSDVAADGSVDDDDDDESDDDYHGPGDQERGLLTDIPLVLGPQEIEALPMIIQAGIGNNVSAPLGLGVKDLQNMQAVRCNILLAQETGRNLLRELLIFIAAWDLQEDEFYFKLMVQIMEAILQNGLMPFAYQTFSEVKDIVSPAQSIVIKILTQIFRKKQGLLPVAGASAPAASTPRRKLPSRVDLLVVRYIFTIFRQSIIPETCALIYLQGQIRAGAALPEDFPLNLWDMERVYEGVYQFLEFFAVLTESEDWKDLLVKWEIVSELITLLRELDASIPKAPLSQISKDTVNAEGKARAGGAENGQDSVPLPLAVERPYDPVTESPPNDYNAGSVPNSPSQALDNQEPAEFEWRNLKKLVVLVLSSLVWKSPTVQNQIRQYGGVEMILNCCNFDANNPYIREHAIMCLRFLLEGSKENQAIVNELEPREGVPNEVLDKSGYETFIDEAGKVGLRRKDGAVAVAQMQ